MKSSVVEKFIEKVKYFSSSIEEKNKFESVFFDQYDKDLIWLSENFSKTNLSMKIHNDNPLKRELMKVSEIVEFNVHQINEKKNALMKRISVQSEFSDKLIIIIYGKVNAGKSSFANYLMELLSREINIKPQMFEIKEGKKTEFIGEEFKEGVTETTKAIQGVEIGSVVLLDSPGLHSVNEVNGNLAKSYTDSADLILWLTPSSSPGQAQELDSLKVELAKNKILIPVISKSDFIEEDEVGGEIVSLLKMKSASTQVDQQKDVLNRTIQYFKENKFNYDKQLQQPCSLSINFAKNFRSDSDVSIVSGLDALFEKVINVYESLLDAKVHNLRNQSSNHCREVEDIFTELIDVIEKTLSIVDLNKEKIKAIGSQISRQLLSDVKLELPRLIENVITIENKQKAKEHLIDSVNNFMQIKLSEYVDIEFSRIFKSLADQASAGLTPDLQITADLEDNTFTYYQIEGRGAQAATIGGAALAGAALGSVIPGVGTLIGAGIGSFLGTLFGSAASDVFIKQVAVTEIDGVDSTKIESEINTQLNLTVPQVVDHVLRNLMGYLLPLESLLNESKDKIIKVKL